MTIQEPGSLGEVMGALAVLISVVYLSIQTRLTRLAAEETPHFAPQQATATNVNIYSRWRQSLQNPQLAEIIVRADPGQDLTEAE